MKRGRMSRILAAALFCICSAVYFFSPARAVMDSHYSMLLGENLWRHHSFALDRYFVHPDRHWSHAPTGTNLPYHVYRHAGHIFYTYPPGSSVLSIPIVMAANAAGITATHPRNGYDRDGELNIERIGAALVAALTVAVIFLASLQFLDERRAAAVALAAAFATGLWSTASRVLWSHTWGCCLLAVAILVLARAANGARLRPVLLASLVGLMYLTRPATSFSVIAITLFVALRHRRDFLPYALTGAVWLAIFLVFTFATTGHLLSPYYKGGARFTLQFIREGVPGILVSPSRGLFVYSPATLIAFWFAWRNRSATPLLQLATGAVLLNIVVMFAWPMWWGGFGYGARLLTDIVPWLALMAALGWSAAIETPRQNKPATAMAARAAAVLLLAVSVAMQAVGAFSMAAWRWNIFPNNIDEHQERLWDWRNAQFLQPFVSGK